MKGCKSSLNYTTYDLSLLGRRTVFMNFKKGFGGKFYHTHTQTNKLVGEILMNILKIDESSKLFENCILLKKFSKETYNFQQFKDTYKLLFAVFVCSWQTDETCNNDDKNHCDDGLAYITGLEPWTRYAVYMQALTLSKAIQGAISNIVYFRTSAEGKLVLYHIIKV